LPTNATIYLTNVNYDCSATLIMPSAGRGKIVSALLHKIDWDTPHVRTKTHDVSIASAA